MWGFLCTGHSAVILSEGSRLWTLGEDGNFKDGNRLIFKYTYRTVGGFQLPADGVVSRESHHEVWRYTLSDCSVKTNR